MKAPSDGDPGRSHRHRLGPGATVVHTAGFLLVTALVAVLVFERLGLALLRTARVNLDVIWAGASMATGGLTLAIYGTRGGGDVSARDKRHGAIQVRATERSLQADDLGHEAMTIAKRMMLTHLATVGPAEVRDLPQAWPVRRHHVRHIVQQLVADGLAECLDASRIIHARSSVRLTTGGRAARAQPAMALDTGNARLARSA